MLRIPCTMTKGSCGRISVKVAGICHIVNMYAEKEVLVVCVDVIARVVNAAIFWPCVYDDSVSMCDAFLLVLLILRLGGGVCAGGYPEPVQQCRSCLLLNPGHLLLHFLDLYFCCLSQTLVSGRNAAHARRRGRCSNGSAQGCCQVSAYGRQLGG